MPLAFVCTILLMNVSGLKIQAGVASWYGPGFHGRRTASGERFNQYACTLASRHLPLGTRVLLINLRTGKHAIARVNDRGPYVPGRIADLSKGLARKLGARDLEKIIIIQLTNNK